MTAKQALKACEKLSKTHGFICTEKQHLCLYSEGGRGVTHYFSIAVFKNSEMLELFHNEIGFSPLVARIKKYIAIKP